MASTGTITVVNETSDNTNLIIAIYQKPNPGSTSPVVAWRVTPAPVGNPVYVSTFDNYDIFVKYTLNGRSYATQPIPIPNADLMGAYQVSKGPLLIEMDRLPERPAGHWVEVRAMANLGQAVEVNITVDSHLAYPPFAVQPGMVLQYTLSNGFYAALIGESVNMGDILDHSVVAHTEVAVGPGQTVRITGTAEAGYKLSVTDNV
jgi:hypothetical protein